MTQSIDNSEWVMQGVIRDPVTGALLRVNADGSLNVTVSPGGGAAGTGFTSATTAGTAVVGTLNSSGLSLGVPAFLTTARGSTDGLGLNTAGTNITWTANSSGVSINAAGYAGTTTAITGNAAVTLNSLGLQFNGAGLAGTVTAMTSATATLNSAGLSLSIGAYITTGRASTDAVGLNTAQTNVTWTVNSAGISFNASGYGGTATAITGNALITHNSAGFSFNGSGLAGTATAVTNASITVNSAGVSLNVPLATISSYMNELPVSALSQLSTGSVSDAVSFNMPNPISFSFMRFPAAFANGSTSTAATAASLSASNQRNFTFNAVIYTLGTGASSTLLSALTSAAFFQTVLNSVSVAANGSQISYTVAMSFGQNGTTTLVSTQYSATDTVSYNFSSTQWSNYSGNRFLDIPFAGSLSAGNYWLLFGFSSVNLTNSTGISIASANIGNVFKSMMYATNINSLFGIGGSTNLTQGPTLGAGQFSTVGGGTTANLPISAISTIASHPMLVFQLVRSA